MPLKSCSRFSRFAAAALAIAATWSPAQGSEGEKAPAADSRQSARESRRSTAPDYATETLRGRIVWLAEALQRRYNVETDPDSLHAAIALETADGGLVPIVKDFRSRGFWIDPRLRATEVEILARRYPKSPAVQMIRWYAIREGHRYEVDYWCDVCAIPMYELKTCECCQGETRLRERPVESEAP